MSVIPHVPFLGPILRIIGDALDGQKSDEEVAIALLESAFNSGVNPRELMKHLDKMGIERAELAADLAQWAKTRRP